MPYNYKVLLNFSDINIKYIYKKENELKKYFKNDRIQPENKFGGSSTECFNIKIKKEVLQNVELWIKENK